jgi:hypothetical protein
MLREEIAMVKTMIDAAIAEAKKELRAEMAKAQSVPKEVKPEKK